MQKKPKIVVIVGPTASGKSGLAVELAKRFGGEVISADSRQVYRGMDIGTEKIAPEEMRGIPHHLLDVRDPADVYTAADFKTDAERIMADIAARGAVPIVAGGTFFYVETLFGTALPNVPPNPTLRAELEALAPPALFALLEKKDPVRAETIDRHNARRLVRALEITAALGAVPPPVRQDSPHDALIVGIETDPADLRERIQQRLSSALDRGLIEETKRLLDGGVSRERLSEIGLEYRVVLEYLDGTISADELREKLVQKVWQYAKRQMTWLRKMKGVEWCRLAEKEEIFEKVEEFLD